MYRQDSVGACLRRDHRKAALWLETLSHETLYGDFNGIRHKGDSPRRPGFFNQGVKSHLTYYEHMPIIPCDVNEESAMPRPKHCRRVMLMPNCRLFKPAGVPAASLGEVTLAVDEFEALRLADYEGLYQQGAAQRMGVSRQTFGRIVEAGRKKVAKALVKGLALRIEGGEVKMAEMRTFNCAECGHSWQLAHGRGRPSECPQCQNGNIRRAEEERGAGKGRQRRRKCGQAQA